MEWLFSIPYIEWIVVGLISLIVYQRVAPRLRVRVPKGPSVSRDDFLGKIFGERYRTGKLENAARREIKQGNWLGAGRIYEEAGMLQKAADAFVDGQEFFAAASVLEKMGKLERAAELYLQSGDFKKAASVFQHAGRPARAAALFLEKGNTLEAARLYGLAGEWGKAGDLYSRSGYPLRAAEAFEKKGEFLKAAECQEKHFMENVSFSTTYSSTSQSPDQKSALLAGRLYEKAGDLARAHQIYVKGGYFLEAGRSLEALGQPARAAEYYMRAEDPEAAAQAFERAGDRVKAANLRGELALKGERLPEAAGHFQEGQDYLRAAELYESQGMLAEAAGAYEAGESWVAAANVYVRAGLKDKAAAAFERGGDFENAADFYEQAGLAAKATELYDRAGLTFKSGEAAARSGDRDRAIALLQRVTPADENYRAATELLASLFIEANMPALAVERLQKAISGQPVSAANLDLYYWLAAGNEALGNSGEALALYKKVLAEDLRYRDAGQRAARLQASGAAAASPGAPPDRWVAALRSFHERGIATLQVCPSCGRCYDNRAAACGGDRSQLIVPRALPFTLASRYRLEQVLGEGGMGIVFQAQDEKLDRSVAIKIVNAEEFHDPGMRTRLEREARAVAKVNHPGVIGIYDSGDLPDGSAFLVMEMLAGWDLSQLLKAYGRGSPRQVALLLRQAGAAVTAAHRVGVVHRDLKPQNLVLVNAAGGFQVKVLDFGLAKTTSVESGITRTGTLVGTPAYMSPEQVQGPAIDARSDLYSLAVVGYEALTGQRLVPEGDLMRQLFAVTHGSVPKLSALLPELPGEVDEAFALALAKDPAQRPADIESWLQSFSYALATAKNGAAGWPEPLPPPPPRRRLRSASSSESSPTAPTVGSPPGSSAASGHAPGTQATAATEAEPTAPPAAAARPAAPARGSRFVAKEELGRGPLGSVYRAEDQVDGRSVALRIVPPQLLQGDGVLASLVADLKAAAQLSHPNVVKVLGFVELGGQRCVVTEFVSGRNFSEALRAGHKMSFKQAHSLGRVLAGVLAFIHGKGLVHGSIQPSNVMVSQGVVKVADLGLVRLSRAVQRDVDYQAPEAQPDVAGDIFAMAAVLYHLLTGVHPRSQPQGVALPLPSTLAGGVPEAFDKLLIRALQPRVELRHASAEEFLAELKGMVHIG